MASDMTATEILAHLQGNTRSERADFFALLYTDELLTAVTAAPSEYGYSVDDVPRVVERMRLAFIAGTYNHDGKAIRGTCKILGIKHTRKALESYFNAEGA